MRLIAALVFFAVGSASGQDYKPYPLPKISREQWQAYFDEVRGKQMPSERQFPAENLVVYHSTAVGMNWAFTTSGHPAHPAWITRRVTARDGRTSVDQIGYFAGDEAQFAALFESYLRLTDRATQDLKNKGGK